MSAATVESRAAAPPLGKHEELSTPSPERCICGPRVLRLRADDGELIRVRGGCVNRCEYCAKLAAVENCEMLVLDALEGDAPQLVAILGTRTPTVDMAAFARAREKVIRAVRRRWPDAQYAYQVEFTTGMGPRSGGRRRPHWNWFWKGIPRQDAEEAREVIVRIWCEHVDAESAAQYVAEIDNAVGLTKYVTQHFMKESQRPPRDFTGQRFCASRGYFRGTTVAVARARARESLRRKRELHKALEAGFPAREAERIAREAYAFQLTRVWTLASDYGSCMSSVIHDGFAMSLPSDRRRALAMRPSIQPMHAVAQAPGLACGISCHARPRADTPPLRRRSMYLPPMQLHVLLGPHRKSADRPTHRSGGLK